ncbi:hypothetical protein AMV106 [Betaentomopoxvirus amoorei]|uniref:AMV106 n=1 Tax=Amsacta moorei entomopoxvirus TaxID=28321 RepID=Q9EMU3_AMEPV|nr:hypothetical protein AMV106 [Amsacta moorei entomopoxvirus]AAG02812.1 AMV106 [Amsacta moorei entomopoxvirus]
MSVSFILCIIFVINIFINNLILLVYIVSKYCLKYFSIYSLVLLGFKEILLYSEKYLIFLFSINSPSIVQTSSVIEIPLLDIGFRILDIILKYFLIIFIFLSSILLTTISSYFDCLSIFFN